MNDIVDLPEEIGGRLQQLRDRLSELEREASEEDELAERLERLSFLLDDLEQQADADEERSLAEDEQRRQAESKLHRLQALLDDLDRQVSAEVPAHHPSPGPLSAASADVAIGGAATSSAGLAEPAALPDTTQAPLDGAADLQQSRPRSIIISVVALAAVGALVLLLSGMFNSPAQGANKVSTPSGEVGFTGAVLDGRNLFQQNCVTCHGAEGNKLPANPLMSKAYLAKLDDDSLAKTIADGRGIMPAWGIDRGGTLGDDQIDSVISYLRYTSGTPRTKPPMSAQIRMGRDLFQKNCVACHGAKGNRIPATPLDSSEFLGRLGDGGVATAVTNGKGSMPAFGSAKGGSLSSDRMAALGAYLKYAASAPSTAVGSSPPKSSTPSVVAPSAPGQAVPAASGTGTGAAGKDTYAKNCQGCHGAKGDQFPGVKLFDKQFLDSRGDPALAKTIGQGRGGMPGFGSALSDQDIKALVAYLRSQ